MRKLYVAVVVAVLVMIIVSFLVWNYLDQLSALKHETDRWAAIRDVNGDRIAVELQVTLFGSNWSSCMRTRVKDLLAVSQKNMVTSGDFASNQKTLLSQRLLLRECRKRLDTLAKTWIIGWD